MAQSEPRSLWVLSGSRNAFPRDMNTAPREAGCVPDAAERLGQKLGALVSSLAPSNHGPGMSFPHVARACCRIVLGEWIGRFPIEHGRPFAGTSPERHPHG